MAISEVITLSPAGAEIPGQRCEAPSFSIPVPTELLSCYNYDACARLLCDHLSAIGIANFLHYNDVREIELLDSGEHYTPIINHQQRTIALRELAHA